VNTTEALLRVLVVDDRPDVRLSFCFMLEASGYAVAEAGDGAEALALLARQRIDVILTDLHMPGMDGTALIRLVRRTFRPPPIIIAMTGTSSPWVTASSEAAGEIGADAILLKPITKQQIIQAIRSEGKRRTGHQGE
jgi:two-component system, OmpR family, response regulator